MTIGKRSRIIICSLFLPVSWAALIAQGSSEHGTLIGDVADKAEGAPLPDAFLYIHGSAGKFDSRVKLDANGRFELSLSPGLYNIFVAADGFVPSCNAISIDARETTHFTPRMEADNQHLEQSSHR